MTWAEFLSIDNRRMTLDHLDHGIVYTPPDRRHGGTADECRDYLAGFGWRGVTVSEVAARIGRDKRGVERVMRDLLAHGEITCEQQPTRGRHATRRKVYYSTDYQPLAYSTDDLDALVRSHT